MMIKSVTYVSGILCNLCLRPHTDRASGPVGFFI